MMIQNGSRQSLSGASGLRRGRSLPLILTVLGRESHKVPTWLTVEERGHYVSLSATLNGE